MFWLPHARGASPGFKNDNVVAGESHPGVDVVTWWARGWGARGVGIWKELYLSQSFSRGAALLPARLHPWGKRKKIKMGGYGPTTVSDIRAAVHTWGCREGDGRNGGRLRGDFEMGFIFTNNFLIIFVCNNTTQPLPCARRVGIISGSGGIIPRCRCGDVVGAWIGGAGGMYVSGKCRTNAVRSNVLYSSTVALSPKKIR